MEDLIYAPSDKFLDFIDRTDANRREGATTEAASERQEIYAVEVENPPFVGSKTAVFNPARRLAYRFLELPHHVQREIVEALGLFQEEDRNRPVDEQFNLFFRRAAENGKLADLWQRVEQRYPHGYLGKNPFPKPQT